MDRASDKQKLNFSTEIEIAADEYWVIVKIEERTKGLPWDEPGPVYKVRIPASNLILAKIYKDLILCSLLKWRALSMRNRISNE